MELIPSPPNEWPQQNNQIDDQKGGSLNTTTITNNNNNNNNMGSVGGLSMDQKLLPITQIHHQDLDQQKQQQNHQEPLRCPRCDSTNTKFCYYNNYSLSQPRHFCKACKRYWTRGGTLRSVPVGGGCRKNKRVKRPSNNSSSSSSSALTNTNLEASNSATSGQSIHDLISSASKNHVNPLFFGMPTTDSNINFPFSRYDLQTPSQIQGLGLGFSSSSSSSSSGLVHSMNGLSFNVHNHPASKQIFQDLISSNPLISSSNYTNPNTDSSSPTVSSFLASTLQMKGASSNFQTLLPSYEDDLQMKTSAGGMFSKDVKLELEGQNRSLLNHHTWSGATQNQVEDLTMASSSSDPSVLWGGGANSFGAWLDPSNNIGSSVPSLI